MQINLTDHDKLLSTQDEALLQRRLLLALARYDSRVEAVRVDVSAAGEGGELHLSAKNRYRCAIEVHLRHREPLVATNEGSDIEACLTHAAQRVGRAVGRQIERSFHDEGRRKASLLPSGEGSSAFPSVN